MRQGNLFAALPLALALVGAAQAAESSLDALFACREISADAARLACLDREVAALRGESRSGALIAEPAASSAERAGSENLAVARVSETPQGKLVVKLQNGQVWTQTDSIRIFIARGTAHEEMTASVRNAALGSYKMQLNGDGPWFRVTREK